MARDNRLRDPRVEPIDTRRSASDAYLHRAARLAVLLALPTLTQAHALPQIRAPRRPGAAIERSLPRQASSRRDLVGRASGPGGGTSPVALDGLTGRPLAVAGSNDLDAISAPDPGEAILPPPAISGDRLYVRAQEAIYGFGEEG